MKGFDSKGFQGSYSKARELRAQQQKEREKQIKRASLPPKPKSTVENRNETPYELKHDKPAISRDRSIPEIDRRVPIGASTTSGSKFPSSGMTPMRMKGAESFMTTDKSFSQFSSTGMKGKGQSPLRKNLSDNGNRILMNSGTGSLWCHNTDVSSTGFKSREQHEYSTFEEKMQRKKRIQTELAAVEEKVGKSVGSMLEQKCSELTIELERTEFDKQRAHFELEKATLELSGLRIVRPNQYQKERELDQRVLDLETKYGNVITELEQERNGRGKTSSTIKELEMKVEGSRKVITSLREELHNERNIRDQIQKEMNVQLEALSQQLTEAENQRDKLQEQVEGFGGNEAPSPIKAIPLANNPIAVQAVIQNQQEVGLTEIPEEESLSQLSKQIESERKQNYDDRNEMSSPSFSVKSKVTYTTQGGGASIKGPGGFEESDGSIDPIKAKIIDLQKEVHGLKQRLKGEEQNRKQNQGVMRKKEEDLKKAKEKYVELEKRIQQEEEAKRRLQTIIKQRDSKITVLQGKMNQILQENQKLKKQNKETADKLQKLNSAKPQKIKVQEPSQEEILQPVKAKPFLFGPDPEFDF